MFALSSSAQRPEPATESLANRILRMSEAEQIAYTNSVLGRGLPADETSPLVMLILNRSSLVLPIMERKIEEVLKSASPLDCFTDKTVDPQRFVDLAARSIAYAGDEQALKEISKLIAIDERRFGILVRNTLVSVHSTRNPFEVAYRGFEIGAAAVDKRIMAWVETQFENQTEFAQGQLKHSWANAMAKKYGGAPNEVNWVTDPIASRIRPALAASLHDEVMRLAAEASEKPSK
jgi:hypothetical protein